MGAGEGGEGGWRSVCGIAGVEERGRWRRTICSQPPTPIGNSGSISSGVSSRLQCGLSTGIVHRDCSCEPPPGRSAVALVRARSRTWPLARQASLSHRRWVMINPSTVVIVYYSA